jgi:hypothetical protein
MSSLFGGVAGSWARVDDGPPNNFVFNYTAGLVWSCRWDDSISTYAASPTFFLEGLVKARSTGTTLAGLVFGKAAGNNHTGYQILIDRRNASGSSSGFHLRKNIAFSPSVLAFDNSVTIVSGRWYKIQVDWRTSGTRITARLYDTTTDTLISTITSNDTAYTTGRIGIIGYQETSHDNIIVVP